MFLLTLLLLVLQVNIKLCKLNGGGGDIGIARDKTRMYSTRYYVPCARCISKLMRTDAIIM